MPPFFPWATAWSIRVAEAKVIGEASEPMHRCPEDWWLEECNQGIWCSHGNWGRLLSSGRTLRMKSLELSNWCGEKYQNANLLEWFLQLIACKAEALLKLHQVEEAESILSNIPKLENYPPCCSQTKVFGMLAEVYLLYVRAQVEMALGRYALTYKIHIQSSNGFWDEWEQLVDSLQVW